MAPIYNVSIIMRSLTVSLQVVVQRADVQLPTSLSMLPRQPTEDQEVDDEGSQLLTCDICRITVHQCK